MGLSVQAAAATVRKSSVDFFCDLLVEEQLVVSLFFHIGIDENVRTMLSHLA